MIVNLLTLTSKLLVTEKTATWLRLHHPGLNIHQSKSMWAIMLQACFTNKLSSTTSFFKYFFHMLCKAWCTSSFLHLSFFTFTSTFVFRLLSLQPCGSAGPWIAEQSFWTLELLILQFGSFEVHSKITSLWPHGNAALGRSPFPSVKVFFFFSFFLHESKNVILGTCRKQSWDIQINGYKEMDGWVCGSTRWLIHGKPPVTRWSTGKVQPELEFICKPFLFSRLWVEVCACQWNSLNRHLRAFPNGRGHQKFYVSKLYSNSQFIWRSWIGLDWK